MSKLTFTVCLLALSGAGALLAVPPKDDAAIVEDSTIINTVRGDSNASGGSSVNRGIDAKGAAIVDGSTVSSNSSGNVNAVASRVNTGVSINGATISGSNISANSNANINAVNSTVRAGAIELGGANGSNVSTNVNASVNAVNSVVNIGTVRGNADGVNVSANASAAVDVKNKTVNIGTVNLNGGGSGGAASYKDRHQSEPGKGASGGGANIGNVTINNDVVKDISTTVGSAGSVGDKIKTRNLAKTYQDEGGVDPSGTKNVYVSRQDVKAAEKTSRAGKTGSVGNTVLGNSEDDRKVRKVNTFVDQ